MRIDAHTHVMPPDLPDFQEKYGQDRWPVVVKTSESEADIMVSGKLFRKVTDQVWSPEKIIADMDREGIDMQVVSPIPVTFSYWAPVDQALEMIQLQNNFIGKMVKDRPNRFIGLGTVPMQDPKAAIKEMDRCVHELGLSGIEIGTNVNGENLDAPEFLEFFKKAEEWDVLVFIHPWETMAKDRTPRHNFMYTVGMPSETALAAASLIWGGVVEKCPNLRFWFAHGAGSFPYILPRLDQGWRVWPDLRVTEKPPSEYVKNFYFDALTYDERNTRYLIEKFGEDRIVMGSDYPFLLKESPPGKTIDQMEDLSDEIKDKLLYKNALQLLGVKEGQLENG
ncbi:amidohydrolase family protein [Alteribacter natronophilus]|uniref:amidohydrolase family protein n=1 Tax=Alteribacter natronophilus TaxID=2583810 RepID=UPI00110F49CA|nr:amidohydrolase family protein [Alteribacter natronophilus]TMW70612.1 amidohydrolase [Alteribacter natronophilus]